MNPLERLVGAVGGARSVMALGGVYIAAAVTWTGVIAQAGVPLTELVIEFLLIAGPGTIILYGGYRLPASDLHPSVYPRIVGWTLGGFAVMAAVLALIQLNPAGGLERPIFSVLLATALGSTGGFGIGRNEARALSRAREAEQHRAEAERQRDELQKERDLRERIIEASPIGIVILDPDGSIRMANEHAARITGVSVAELEALDHFNDPRFEITDADGEPIEGGMFQEILETEVPLFDVERRVTRADGQRIWLSLNGAPLHGPADELRAIVVAFEDVTEQVKYEQQLRESNERLEQFAYAASHDLQEPLRMVSSYLQLLEDRYRDDLDEDAEEFIGFAVDGADRMRGMIESLLEYSRVTTHGDPLEPTDVDAVLADVSEDLHIRIEESETTITVDDELPTVSADADQLRQVFENLFSNAIAYSGDDPPRIHVGATRTDGAWRFSVADEGVGIDPRDQDRIFDVFESTPSDDGAGSGIGLAIVERIVERHGGDIWVESEPGEGATFYFTFPAIDGRSPEQADEPESHGEASLDGDES